MTAFLTPASTRPGAPGDGGLRVLEFANGGLVAGDRYIQSRVQDGFQALAPHIRQGSVKTDSGGYRPANNAFQVGLRMWADNARRVVAAQQRADSGYSAGMGGAVNPTDLTHKMARVLAEKKAPLRMQRLLSINSEVPPGAAKYRIERTYSAGQAVPLRGQDVSQIPQANIGGASMDANVVVYVTRVRVGWLENLRAGFAGIDTEARKMAAARRVIDETIDRVATLGDSSVDLFGVFNHPYMDVEVSSVTIGGASTSTAEEISDAMSVWANYASEASGGAFEPNTVLMASKIHNYMANKRFGSGSDRTILEHFKKAHPHIQKVEVVHRFDDIGGSGVHGMLFMRSKDGQGDSSLELVVPMAQTVLPPQVGSLSTDMVIATMFGGVLQTSAGDNLFVLAGGR